LGYFYTKAVKETGWEKLLLVGWFIPILDETLQLFSPGRASFPIDMLIDMAGYLGALIVLGSFPRLLKII